MIRRNDQGPHVPRPGSVPARGSAQGSTLTGQPSTNAAPIASRTASKCSFVHPRRLASRLSVPLPPAGNARVFRPWCANQGSAPRIRRPAMTNAGDPADNTGRRDAPGTIGGGALATATGTNLRGSSPASAAGATPSDEPRKHGSGAYPTNWTSPHTIRPRWRRVAIVAPNWMA